MRSILLMVVATTSLLACVTNGEAERKQRRAQVLEGYRRELAVRETYGIPADYRERVDQWFVATLKDPDSRKVEFIGTRGPMACGHVNAKNSYGGYTGRVPFGALFDQTGKLKNVWLFDHPIYDYYGESNLDDAVVALACGWPLRD